MSIDLIPDKINAVDTMNSNIYCFQVDVQVLVLKRVMKYFLKDWEPRFPACAYDGFQPPEISRGFRN